MNHHCVLSKFRYPYPSSLLVAFKAFFRANLTVQRDLTEALREHPG